MSAWCPGAGGDGVLRTGEKSASCPRAAATPSTGWDASPESVAMRELSAGEVDSWPPASRRSNGAPVGDTITAENSRPARPSRLQAGAAAGCFAGVFPINSEDYESFRDALASSS